MNIDAGTVFILFMIFVMIYLYALVRFLSLLLQPRER